MRTHRVIASTTAILALVAGSTGFAQTTIQLDEIVFSANLVATRQASTGASVTVLSPDQLEAAGDGRLSDLLTLMPGVMVHDEGPMGQQSVLRIRGSNPRYVAVYVDGIRVDDPSGIASEFNFGHLSAGDIGRVELLRGSQSALYGSSAIAGVIDITTNRPEQDGFSHTLSAEAGSYNTLSARYGLAYRDARLEAALTLSQIRTDGFSAFDTLPATPGLEADGYDSRRLSFSARYQATDTLAFGGAFFAQHSDADYDGWGADSTVNQLERRETGARIFAELEAGNSTHEFEATHYALRRSNDEGFGLDTYKGVRTGFGYRGTTDLSDAWTLVYGADTMQERVTTPMQGPNTTRISGAFAQALWAPNAQWDGSLTGRIDHDSDFGTFPTGRLALAYNPSDALTLRGALARGYRAPSIFERLGEPIFGIDPNPDLTPEESISAEIGADYRFGNGAEVSATLFHINVDNMIGYISGPPDQYQNVSGRSPREGLELAASLPVNDWLTLGGAYTWVDARTATGVRQNRVPRHNLALSADMRLGARLNAGFTLQHVADRPDDGGTAMADFTVAKANFRYTLTDSADLTLRVDNLFNTQYQHAAGYATSDRAVYLGISSRF